MQRRGAKNMTPEALATAAAASELAVPTNPNKASTLLSIKLLGIACRHSGVVPIIQNLDLDLVNRQPHFFH
jgi:hypothetical protein